MSAQDCGHIIERTFAMRVESGESLCPAGFAQRQGMPWPVTRRRSTRSRSGGADVARSPAAGSINVVPAVPRPAAVRMKAGLILFQQQRLDRAIEMEDQLGGVVLDQVGKGIERLAKLADSYEQSLQLLGVLPRDPGTLVPGALKLTQHNVTVFVAKQINEEVSRLVERIPEELRAPLGHALEAARLAESNDRLKEIEARVRSRAPAPIDVDESADA